MLNIRRSGLGASFDGLDPCILWCVPSTIAERLTDALSPTIPTEVAGSRQSVQAMLRAYPLAVMVAGHGVGDATTAAIVSMARSHAAYPIAALAMMAHHLGEVSRPVDTVRSDRVMLIAAGVYPVDLRDDQGPRGLRPLLEWIRAQRPSRLSTLVFDSIAPVLDNRAATLFKIAIRLAGAPYTLEDLAQACGCSHRSLHRYCLDAEIGPPLRLRAMSRLLTFGFLMDRPRSQIESVVELLQFDSVDAVRVALRRWTGLGLNTVKRSGWISTLKPIIREPT